MIADGYQLLAELGAVDEANELTPIGRQLARFPIDPRVARMILAAERENCLAEVLVIAAVLEIDDPRERPFERAEAADRAHARFHDERSDFLSLLKLWELLRGGGRAQEIEPQAGAGAARAVPLAAPPARMARRAPAARGAGGRDAHARQREARELRAGAPRADRGLLGNVGTKGEEAGEYLGARGIKFSIFPGSGLRKKQPQVGARGGARGNDAALRALRRAHRARMGGGRRRRPREAPLLRPALGEGARHGGGVRARDALRAHARAAAARALRPDQPAGSARGLHPRRAGGRRVSRRARRSSRTTAGSSRRSRRSSTRRAAATCWWTRRRSSRSTTR